MFYLNHENFYQKLIVGLKENAFFYVPDVVLGEGINETKSVGMQKLKKGIEVSSSILSNFFGGSSTKYNHSHFDAEQFLQDINCLSELSNYVFFKFIITQPYFLILVESDMFDKSDFINFCDRYLKLVNQLRHHSGTVQGTRLGALGIVFFVFRDSERADRFNREWRKKCKKSSFFKKTSVFPFTVNLESKTISGVYDNMFVKQILDSRKLSEEVFS